MFGCSTVNLMCIYGIEIIKHSVPLTFRNDAEDIAYIPFPFLDWDGEALVLMLNSVDPGFPVGGAPTRRGGANSRGGYVSKILYVKTKESGPLGGARAGGTPPWIRHC